MISPENKDRITQQLLSLERSLLDPEFRRSRGRIGALLAEDFLEFGASGKIWTRDQVMELLGNEQFEPPAIENFECRMISWDVALVTYQTRQTQATGEITASLRCSLWSLQAGDWRLRFHQGTPAL